MKVYAAMYRPCIYESADSVLSLHTTMAGAEAALEKHKAEQPFKSAHECWDVEEMEIVDDNAVNVWSTLTPGTSKEYTDEELGIGGK